MSTHCLTPTNVHYHVKAAPISIQLQQEVCLNSVCVTQEVRQ